MRAKILACRLRHAITLARKYFRCWLAPHLLMRYRKAASVRCASSLNFYRSFRHFCAADVDDFDASDSALDEASPRQALTRRCRHSVAAANIGLFSYFIATPRHITRRFAPYRRDAAKMPMPAQRTTTPDRLDVNIAGYSNAAPADHRFDIRPRFCRNADEASTSGDMMDARARCHYASYYCLRHAFLL